MKAVISNRIYLEVTPAETKTVKETLTYRIATYGDGPPMIVQNFSTFRKDILTLPVGRTDLISSKHEVVDRRVRNSVSFPAFRHTLRESQQAIHDAVEDNCLINAKVGWGKTFTALAIAAKLGCKTLIVVHTLDLMHQWKKEVEKAFGFTPSMIGGGHDKYDKPITIGNVSSLYKRMGKLGKEFGLIIMDEVHHAPSPTFSKIVDCSYARYKIGLSGTLQRKDGLHVLLQDYFGTTVYSPPKENTLDPVVHAHNTGLIFPGGSCWADRVTSLMTDPAYAAWTVRAIRDYEKLGHKVLMVSDRVNFLKEIAAITNSSLVTGGVEDREAQLKRLDDGDASTICGTLSIWKEGISYNPLSCVILGTPINNEPLLEQLVGRIQRQSPDKLPPVVVDPILRGHTTEKQFTNRVGFYMRQGWTIERH